MNGSAGVRNRPAEWHSWRWQLQNASIAPDPEDEGAIRTASVYPFFATPYAIELASRCPGFAKQVLPDVRELEGEPGAAADPFGELAPRESTDPAPPGLVRRYPDRVLAMASPVCAMMCRHCTRKGLLKNAKWLDTPAAVQTAAAWVSARPEIRDVLVSGGDPLILPDSRVGALVDAFASIGHIDAVRICTRAPCTLPMRITPELAKLLAAPRKVWVNTHFNCAGEVTPEAAAACALLVDSGIPVSCQTVLLKGVNDTAEEMLALLRALYRIRVRPYYVFMCDPMAGVSHFRVSLENAQKLEAEIAERIGGLAMPRFVADIPGARRKTPIASIKPEDWPW